MKALSQVLDRYRAVGQLALRLVLGGLFVYHGFDKFDAGIDMVEGMFRSWGVPAPGLTAPLVAVVEIVGGLLLILGAATRVTSAVLGTLMVGALFYVKTDLGIISSEPMPGAELDLAYLGGLIALVVWGGGTWSVDRLLGIEASTVASGRGPAREPVTAR